MKNVWDNHSIVYMGMKKELQDYPNSLVIQYCNY